MDATLLYDVGRDTLPWWLWPAAWFTLATLLGVGFGYRRRLAQATASEIGPVVLGIAMAAACAKAIHSTVVEYRQHRELAALAASPGPRRVEGAVVDFRPGFTRRGPRAVERFTIEGVEFRYGPDSPAGFERTRPNGGPIEAGMRLRVTWLEDGERRIITRIEALRGPRP
jgi:hypothetical protein